MAGHLCYGASKRAGGHALQRRDVFEVAAEHALQSVVARELDGRLGRNFDHICAVAPEERPRRACTPTASKISRPCGDCSSH